MSWLLVWIEFLLHGFISFVLSIFFRRIVVDGIQNIPTDGAVILVGTRIVTRRAAFTGNHQNQFIDGALILSCAPKHVSFLVAAKSYNGGGIVGFFCRVFRAIPVARPQDFGVKGAGVISLEAESVECVGVGTTFTQDFQPGYSIAFGDKSIRVSEIKSDTLMILSSSVKTSAHKINYKILHKIDQASVYAEVMKRLGEKGCIGIFPEGGSHDRSELLELKAGVALMALVRTLPGNPELTQQGAMQKYGVKVYIVPVGLNYFSGHRFRGSALVEFGKPYSVPKALVAKYSTNSRAACSELLDIVKIQMESVITTAPDIDTLEALHIAWRLYTPSHLKVTTRDYLELNNRLRRGYEMFKDSSDIQSLFKSTLEYRSQLQELGLADRHIEKASVTGNNIGLGIIFLYMRRVLLVTLVVVLALPGTILNAPIGLISRYVAKNSAAKALKESAVKVKALDVLASKKVTTAMGLTPIFWLLYTLIAGYYLGWRWAIGVFFALPLASYASLRLLEEGLAIAKSLFVILKVRWIGKEVKELAVKRRKLQDAFRFVVTEYGKKYAASLGINSDDPRVYESWRIVKETDLEAEKSGNQPRTSTKQRLVTQEPLDALIKEGDWEDLQDIWDHK